MRISDWSSDVCSSDLLARAKLEAAGIAADLRQGDMYALPLPSDGADTVILHQVLHYAQQPASAIAEAGRLLVPGGRLLVADFAPHDREELRRNDAHVRLGFADGRSEEHTSELQSLMRIAYAVFCLQKQIR